MASIFEKDQAELMARRIQSLHAGSKALWGKMNVGQAVCHLEDQIKLALCETTGGDVSNFFLRTLVKHAVVHWLDIPKGKVQTMKELDFANGGGTPPQELEKDKQSLLAKIALLQKLPEGFDYGPHPMFGPLDKKEWGILICKHLDHHLRQFGV